MESLVEYPLSVSILFQHIVKLNHPARIIVPGWNTLSATKYFYLSQVLTMGAKAAPCIRATPYWFALERDR